MDNKKIVEFLDTYSEIVDNFYEDVDEEKIIDVALEGMLEYLEDNYSIFLDKNESSDLTESLDGAYEGIGIVAIGNVVYNVYEGSPAEKAGILVEDEIIEINGTKISLENYDKITELLYKDKENKRIVLRDGKDYKFSIEVSKVKVPSVSTNIIVSEDKKQNIGYLALTTFSAHSYEEFQTELLELEKDGIDSLILDLRDNTGGYLNVVSDISELFLEKGSVIYSLKNKDEKKVYKDKTKDSRKYKIVVLVNANTASASEILAGALHDSYGAQIVGKTTYGKGKVQTVKQYDDSIVKYTSAEWLRPNGECVDEIGIKPDYDVDLEYGQNVIYDLQLDKAIELLS
jgi:carboxyl-terminal processing protease